MAKDIKHRIVLEGEQEYNRAINEAKRNLKTLRSELKAETAELGANATAQQKNEARAKSLREQIKEQEKIVKTLRSALQEAREQYGDNADEIAKWEQKLNDARATLGNMKNDLDRAGSGFKQLGGDAAAAVTATKSVADAMENIGQAGESVASAIEGIFSGIISTIESAARRTWELIAETAAKANNWTDLGNIYGSSAQEIQMWSKSIEAAGGDFSKFLTIVSQLSFGGDAKEKKITEALGISKENYQDDIKYTLAVLDELEKRRKRLGQGWYDETMAELFGTKRSADVSWFMANAYGHEAENGEWIYGWRDNPERFNGNESAFGLNDQELVTLNDVYVKMKEIETKWADIKQQVAAGLGTAALEITTSVSGFLDGLAEYMNADSEEDRENALKKMRENMERFFRGIAQIIRDCIKILTDLGEELKDSDDPATKLIGEIMSNLASALQWMIDNQDAVKVALGAIFGAWLVAKLASVAGKLSSIVADITTIQAFKNWKMPTDGGDGTGTGTGGGNGIGTGNGGVEQIATQNVTTGNVQTMYVQNMIGGNGGLPSTGNNPGGGNGFNGYIPILNPGGNNLTGGSGYNLGGGDGAPLLDAGNGGVNIDTGGGDVNIGRDGNGIHLGPDDYSIDGQPGGQPGTEPTGPSTDTDNGPKGAPVDPYSLVPLAVLAIALAPGAIAQWSNEDKWKADAENAEAVADAAEAMGEDAKLLRQINEAIGPKKDENGEYKKDITGLFLDMNPTDQRDWILQGLGDYKKRGILYSDIMKYGDPENDNIAGWRPWSALLRYWGEYTDPYTGEKGEPLEPYEIDELLTYLREIEMRKLQDKMGGEGDDLSGAVERAIDKALENAGDEGGMPDSWWTVTGSGWNRYGRTPDENGITSTDLEGFLGVPAGVESAAEKGVKKGISGLRVEIDGQAAGRILAPYVSQEIAKDMG